MKCLRCLTISAVVFIAVDTLALWIICRQSARHPRSIGRGWAYE